MFKKEKSNFNKLFENNPNVPLKTVLTNPELSISLRNENQALFNYFFPANKDRHILNELIDWALTKNNDPDDFIYSRNAANVLTSPSRKFQQKLYEDGTLTRKLISFINDDKYNESPSFSGQFASILLQNSRQTDFQFFKDNSTFYLRILDHIHLLSYQRALIELFSENIEAVSGSNPQKAVNNLAEYAKNNAERNEAVSHGIFSAIDKIINESSEEVGKHFTENNKFLQTIVDAALKLTKPYIIIDAFRTLGSIFKNVDYKTKRRILDNYQPNQIDFRKYTGKNLYKAYAFYPIFWKQGIEIMTDYFFKDVDENLGIPNSKFCQSYVNVFKEMTFKERKSYFIKLELNKKLLERVNKVKFNGYIYKLVKALSKPPKKDEAPELLDPDGKHPFNSDTWAFIVEKYTDYYYNFKIQKYEELGFEKMKDSFM